MPENIPQAFADCIGGLLSVVAQNITLTIRGAAGVQIEPVLTKLPCETDAQRSHVTLSLGDLYSEETRNVVCRVSLPALAAPEENSPVLHVSADYVDVMHGVPATLTTTLSVARPLFATPQRRNVYLDRQSNRLRAAEAMDEARSLADGGELEKARAVLSAAIAAISNSASAQDELCVGMLRDLTESIADMQSMTDYRAVGAKKIAWKSQEHERERCVSNNGSVYDTELKKQMKEQARAEAEARRSGLLSVPSAAPSLLRLSREAAAPPSVRGEGLRYARAENTIRLLVGNDYREASATDRFAMSNLLADPHTKCDHVRYCWLFFFPPHDDSHVPSLSFGLCMFVVWRAPQRTSSLVCTSFCQARSRRRW